MPSESKRKRQILLPDVNRCGSVTFLWWFYSSWGCPPQRLLSLLPPGASPGQGHGLQDAVLDPGVAGWSLPQECPAVFSWSVYQEPWYCACRFQMALCCVSDIAALPVQSPSYWAFHFVLRLSLTPSVSAQWVLMNFILTLMDLPSRDMIQSFHLHFVVALPGTNLPGSSVLIRANGIFSDIPVRP